MIKTGSHRSRVLSEDSLALSIACLEVGCLKSQRSSRMSVGRHKIELQSFRVIAACCAMKELKIALAKPVASPTQGGSPSIIADL